jgi:hypothetical protein
VAVKIYKVVNKGRDSFTVSYSTKGKRTQKMFADFMDAETYAESAAKKIAHGELDALQLSSADAAVYVRAANEARPTGLPLDLIAKEYAEMWRISPENLIDALVTRWIFRRPGPGAGLKQSFNDPKVVGLWLVNG